MRRKDDGRSVWCRDTSVWLALELKRQRRGRAEPVAEPDLCPCGLHVAEYAALPALGFVKELE
jgi:hypothetical protein